MFGRRQEEEEAISSQRRPSYNVVELRSQDFEPEHGPEPAYEGAGVSRTLPREYAAPPREYGATTREYESRREQQPQVSGPHVAREAGPGYQKKVTTTTIARPKTIVKSKFTCSSSAFALPLTHLDLYLKPAEARKPPGTKPLSSLFPKDHD